MSNSKNPGRAMLEHALAEIVAVLGKRSLLFVPFALANHDTYTARVAEALEPLGVRVTGLHTASDPVASIDTAEAVYVGGGNSFRLLRHMQRGSLLQPLQRRVTAGMPYLGASAGTNLCCPTIRTTNDMPIVQPQSFDALGLLPFQINPHYVDADPTGTHMGETREQRLTEFLEENDVPVLGLREGSWLRVSGESATLGGANGAVVFRRGEPIWQVEAGADLSALLGVTFSFDAPCALAAGSALAG